MKPYTTVELLVTAIQMHYRRHLEPGITLEWLTRPGHLWHTNTEDIWGHRSLILDALFLPHFWVWCKYLTKKFFISRFVIVIIFSMRYAIGLVWEVHFSRISFIFNKHLLRLCTVKESPLQISIFNLLGLEKTFIDQFPPNWDKSSEMLYKIIYIIKNN